MKTEIQTARQEMKPRPVHELAVPQHAHTPYMNHQAKSSHMKMPLPGNHTTCRKTGDVLGAWLATTALLFWLGGPAPVRAQTTANDGNWATKRVALTNTPQAAFMARVGDIDNMGFGWETGFDPFSGESTPGHGYPWEADPADPDGTDRIMVVSSYVGTPPCGHDGYTDYTERPTNIVHSIVLQYALPALTVTNSVLQIFVDDFQAPVWCANYQVTLNGRRATFLEPIINALEQTGPIGKMITVSVPANFLNEVATGRLEFKFDDLTTGAGDGYSIDFIKLLVNAKPISLPAGNISGKVRDAGTSLAIAGAKVVAFGITATTDSSGFYTLTNVPAGLAFVEASASGYATTNQFADVLLGETTTGVDFNLRRAPLTLSIALAVELRFSAWSGVHYVLQFSSDMSLWYDDESITGAGAEVVRYRLVDAPHRFWRVKQN